MRFGEYISQSRKKLGMSQKDLASHIIKGEDNTSITPQYLNDIEHNRRSPSSPEIIEQLARELGVDKDYLYFLAGRLPEDIAENREVDEERVREAMCVFRQTR
ncbi:MAG: helix-turn-helix domain-containing protein [Thermoleophilia bacterium]